MTSSVILKKKYPKDDFGYLSIRYFDGTGKRKIISLKEKLSQKDFDKFFDTEFRLFKRTTTLDYKRLNTKINSKIDDFSIFNLQDTKKHTKSFLKFFQNHINLIQNQQTKNGFITTLKRLNDFKIFKKKNDILFSDIDRNFVLELKNYWLSQNLSSSTIQQYLITTKSVLNIAKKEGLYFELYNYFEKLGLKSTYKNNKILSENDIKILFNMTPDNKHFYIRNMMLFSIFCSGIRVSDLLLLRVSDLKDDYIHIDIKKTSDYIDVRYSNRLFTLLMDIFNFWDNNKTKEIGNETLTYDERKLRELNNNLFQKKYSDEEKKIILSKIKKLPKNDFLFKDFLLLEPSLLNYNKSRELTLEQNKALVRLRGIYNYHLKEMSKENKFDIEVISSHTGRYTWTNYLLTVKKVNLVKIQYSLGHKNLATTEKYINKNFNQNKISDIGNDLDDKLISDIYDDDNEN